MSRPTPAAAPLASPFEQPLRFALALGLFAVLLLPAAISRIAIRGVPRRGVAAKGAVTPSEAALPGIGHVANVPIK